MTYLHPWQRLCRNIRLKSSNIRERNFFNYFRFSLIYVVQITTASNIDSSVLVFPRRRNIMRTTSKVKAYSTLALLIDVLLSNEVLYGMLQGSRNTLKFSYKLNIFNGDSQLHRVNGEWLQKSQDRKVVSVEDTVRLH